MKLTIISSGSKGNAYILSNGSEALLIECGVNILDIKKALNYNYRNVVGCIVTHEHADHSKSIIEVMKLGINIYATSGTLEKTCCTDIYSHRKFIIKSKNQFTLGEFTIMPFDVKHDAAEPIGFLIHHKDCGKVLFLTDTYYCEYTFSGLNNIIIEANYSIDIINQKYGVESGKEFLKNRILKSHFSLENCKGMLKANDLSQVNNIVLIHLSDSNSNELDFKKQVEELTGKKVTVANNNVIINFNKTPF
jgi:phosphoribosyl 1,2-cyclic phosphodiesterase